MTTASTMSEDEIRGAPALSTAELATLRLALASNAFFATAGAEEAFHGAARSFPGMARAAGDDPFATDWIIGVAEGWRDGHAKAMARMAEVTEAAKGAPIFNQSAFYRAALSLASSSTMSGREIVDLLAGVQSSAAGINLGHIFGAPDGRQ